MSLPLLRSRLLWRVLLPLAVTWLAGSLIALGVAGLYTRKAFDRALLDDARAIAASVHAQADEVRFNLTAREVGVALYDQEERVFFAVLRPDGSLIAGQGGLSDGLAGPGGAWTFGDRHYQGLAVRSVTLWREVPATFSVVVAHTTRSRDRMIGQLFTASLGPQALLLLLLGGWLWHSIGSEMVPLARLERELEDRDTHDLSPLKLEPRSRDIAHLTEAFNALLSRIDAGVRAQREFAGNVAHELRTPLAGIRSLAAYGLAQQDPAVWFAQLQRIVISEARASHLVEQLLALALADEARDSLVIEPVAVDLLVRDLLLRLMPRADAAGVDLGAEGIDRPRWALGHVALLEGVLVNLIDNALRYGGPREGRAWVTVAVQEQGAELLVSVTDNGPGMHVGQRERMLLRRQQGQAGHEQGGGFGLGLSIVVRYIELLGGRLTLTDSAQGPGLCVGVWLPRAPAPSAPAGL